MAQPRGRKPKPTRIKLLTGNPGKRPLNQNEPKPQIGPDMPSPPEHLDKEAQAEWYRLAPQLHRLGLLSNIDLTAFAAYCTAYSRWLDAEQAIREKGVLLRAPSGYPMISPYLAIANTALKQIRAFLTEFGMTPSSRSRINIQPLSAESWNEYESFRKSRWKEFDERFGAKVKSG